MHRYDLANLISVCLTAHKIVHNRSLLEQQISTVKTDSPIILITTVLCLYGVGYNKVIEFEKCLTASHDQYINTIAYLEIGEGRYVFLHSFTTARSVRFYDPVRNKNIEMVSDAFLQLWSDLLLVTSPLISVNERKEVGM